MYCFRRMAVGAVVFTAACVTAREQPATINIAQEQQAIRAQRDAMMAAESARDMEKALSFYTEDAVVQSPNTPQIKGTTAIRAMYERSMPHAPPMEAKITEAVITVARSGDIAFESGTAETTIKLPTGNIVAPSKHLILWKKIAGTWYVAGQSWSGDRAPAPPPTK